MGTVRKGKMKPGELTALRFLESDVSAFLANGTFCDRKKPKYKGCSSWMIGLKIRGQTTSSKDYMNTLLVNSVLHHLAYADENPTTGVNEFRAWHGIGAMRPIPYRDYLQSPPPPGKQILNIVQNSKSQTIRSLSLQPF